MPAKKGQSIEKIRDHLFSEPGSNLPALTAREKDKMKRFRLIVKEIGERPYQTDAALRAWIMNEFGRTWHEAEDDIGQVRRIYAVTNMSKDFARYTVVQILMKAMEIAEKKKDEGKMIEIAAKLTKAFKLDKPDDIEIPWDKIIPPQWIITGDAKELGLNQMSEEERIRLRMKYLKESIPYADIIEEDDEGDGN